MSNNNFLTESNSRCIIELFTVRSAFHMLSNGKTRKNHIKKKATKRYVNHAHPTKVVALLLLRKLSKHDETWQEFPR